METASEIAPNIHRIPALFFGNRVVTCHLLVGETHSLLVDTGMSDTPEKYILPYMKKIGFDPANLTFIAGEAALWNSILDENWQPALPPTYCYVDPYIATIERLRGMNIDTYSGAHWPVTRGNDIGAFLDESKNYALHVEQQLLDA